MDDDNEPSQETLDQWSNDPNNWIWGIFYFNKKDKRIFPPKRIKYLGWTINFANPYSVIIVTSIIVLMIILTERFSK